MGRKLKTTVPIADSQLTPDIPNLEQVKLRDDQVKKRQKNNYDSLHRAKILPKLFPGDTVWVSDRRTPGTVVKEQNQIL